MALKLEQRWSSQRHHALPLTRAPSTEIADAFQVAVALITAIVRFLIIPETMSLRWTISSRVLLFWGVPWGLHSPTLEATVQPNRPEMRWNGLG